MSDSRISVGDLVVVVRACCDSVFSEGRTGLPRTVLGFYRKKTKCPHCGWTDNDCLKADFGIADCAPVAWLKRIPPPEELGLTDERADETKKEVA